MSYGKITPKQQEILEFIKESILNRGYPPAVREICEAVHLKSTSSVHSHLETMEKNGYIRRDPTKPRAIEIIDDNFNLVKGESMINAGIFSGDYILVEETPTASDGEIIVALVEDSVTVKRFYKEEDHFRLQPENDAMEPILVPKNTPFSIVGKVIGLFRIFK